MTRPALGSISPLFVVRNVAESISFYCEGLGFEVTYASPNVKPFLAIVRRDGAMLFLKNVDIAPLPNSERHPWARWDAYVYTEEPDGLAGEFTARGVNASTPLADTGDGLRGFEIKDPDGYVLFFGHPL